MNRPMRKKAFYEMIFNWDDVSEYTEENRVGSGAFGNVYHTQYKTEDGKVIEIGLKSIMLNPTKFGTFITEIAASTIPAHPCIMPIIGWNYMNRVKKRENFIIMPFANGADLALTLGKKENRPKDLPTFLSKVAFGVCRAMAAAHKKKILHRDLKLENIMFDTKLDLPLVIDFGLATLRLEDAMKSCCGTDGYRAPEVTQYKYDLPADVYSYGIVLFNILCSGNDFAFVQFYKAVKRLQGGQIDHFLDHAKAGKFMIEQGEINIWRIIEKCIDEDPAKRPTFDQISEMLQNDANWCFKGTNQQKFEEFKTKLYLEENELTSVFNKSESFHPHSLIKSTYDQNKIAEIISEAKQHNGDALIMLSMLWHCGDTFGRSDNFQALFLAIEALSLQMNQSRAIIDYLGNFIGIHFDANDDTDSIFHKTLNRLVQEAQNGDWVAQTRLGILVSQLPNNKMDADSVQNLLIVGKDHNCIDAIYSLDRMIHDPTEKE